MSNTRPEEWPDDWPLGAIEIIEKLEEEVARKDQMIDGYREDISKELDAHAVTINTVYELHEEVAQLNRQQADFEYNASQIIEASEAEVARLKAAADFEHDQVLHYGQLHKAAEAKLRAIEAAVSFSIGTDRDTVDVEEIQAILK